MIHAKTLVADGWLSKVGSTNLNFSSLAANWEIDLVVEDTDFASQMEELFEDDISKSREVRLEGSGQRQRVRPDGRVDTTDSGLAPVSSAAARDRGRPLGLAPPSSRRALPLQTHEHVMAARAAPLGGCRCSAAPAPHRLAARGCGAFLGGLASCARSNLRSPTARRTGRSRVRRSEGWKMEQNEDLSRRSRKCWWLLNRTSLRLQVTDLLLGDARRTKGGPGAERCPATDRSGAGSLRTYSTRPSTANGR